MSAHPRSLIYYWKCDRPEAFHGTAECRRDCAEMAGQLRRALLSRFPGEAIGIRATPSQGNHLTFIAEMRGTEFFVRVEDGPEHDDYIEVESHIIEIVRSFGVPVPRIVAVDASHSETPFAWQVMERIAFPDLNQHYKQGTLDLPGIAGQIGAAVAMWQGIQPPGFGPFDPKALRETGILRGFHVTYAGYFYQHLDRHLHFLVQDGFLAQSDAEEIWREIEAHHMLLNLDQGCLVHKDLALWNILGGESRIAAFIDFDDAISGEPMDDFSLLGCFHGGDVLSLALDGYQAGRPLPKEHRRRFWLHLLRNMIVKAVIRVGAGYFNRRDSFFLIGSGGSGQALRDFTVNRLRLALQGLREDRNIATL